MIRALLFWSVFFLLAVSGAYASYGEFELFDRAYEFYLSYQPEKAAETFRTFLREFPESSAKDAALFWLGKCLIRTNVEEAKKVFSELKRQFPESPMIPYVNREVESLAHPESRRDTDANKNEKVPEAVKAESARENGQKEAERKMQLLEGQLARAAEEKDRLGVLLEEEKRKAETVRATMTELEKRDPKDAPKYRKLLVTIKDKEYTAEQVLDFMATSSLAMSKGGIREIPWRNGSLFEDFINEQILYDEARRQNVAADAKKQKELAEKFRLTAEEAEYLGRYLAISDLVDGEISNMPEERVVESLTVRYTEKDKQEKVVLANELQTQAKSGRSLEEISRTFPEKTRFSVVGFQEMQGWIKERIELLQDGEVSVVWTKDGYMILRPTVKKASYRPFEETRPVRNDEIRAFVREWVEELKKEMKGIGVLRAE